MPGTTLPTFRLQPGTAVAPTALAAPPRVTADSPALDIVTDLTQVRAVTTPPTASLHQAEQTMIHQRVRLLLVVTEWPVIEGLVTTTDLHGDRQMRLVHERGAHYDELTVADVMTPVSMLEAVAHAAVAVSTVRQLVATLQRLGRNHLLVMDQADGAPRLRGIVSRSQIERQLGQTIPLTPIASSFSEIERALV